jgi:hypothetical protein
MMTLMTMTDRYLLRLFVPSVMHGEYQRIAARLTEATMMG